MADPVITADDAIRAGACVDGVADVVKRLWKLVPAAMPASQLMALVKPDEREYVIRAADLDGSGSGSGSGDGYGDGSGYGSGSGDGYGSGYGSGDGASYA
jgi:hypothetical protein